MVIKKTDTSRTNTKDRQARLLNSLRPARVNDKIYRPINVDDPAIQKLAADIEQNGVLEPIVVTTDDVILSGHRRHAAAKIAGLRAVPTRVYEIHSTDPEFVNLLVSFNTQRPKTRDEQLREEMVTANPDEAYQALLEHREATAAVTADFIELREEKCRKSIGPLKQQLVVAVIQVVNERKRFWPITVRSVHYAVLNVGPMRNLNTQVPYINDLKSYNDITDICARMRLNGMIPFNCISDETRPVFEWNIHQSTTSFIRCEVEGFLKGYRRDLQQSQANLIEVLAEKNSIVPMIKNLVGRYGITLTSGRGYSSLDPRHKMAQRFNASGREKLIVIVLSDHDPEGEDIPHSFACSMRDDFGIQNVECLKAALTSGQVETMNLPSSLEAKESSARYSRFVEQNGTRAVELEALTPDDLQSLLRDAIDSVLDVEAFNAELRAEKDDAAFLDPVRRRVNKFLQELNVE